MNSLNFKYSDFEQKITFKISTFILFIKILIFMTQFAVTILGRVLLKHNYLK